MARNQRSLRLIQLVTDSHKKDEIMEPSIKIPKMNKEYELSRETSTSRETSSSRDFAELSNVTFSGPSDSFLDAIMDDKEPFVDVVPNNESTIVAYDERANNDGIASELNETVAHSNKAVLNSERLDGNESSLPISESYCAAMNTTVQECSPGLRSSVMPSDANIILETVATTAQECLNRTPSLPLPLPSDIGVILETVATTAQECMNGTTPSLPLPLSSDVGVISEPLASSTPEPSTSDPKRKRIRDPDKRRDYDKEMHCMLQPCKPECRNKCRDKIDESRRKEIWQLFWSLDRQRRRDFISRNVKRAEVKVKCSKHSQRSCTLNYNLNDNKVCKEMFLHTIGYTNDQVVQAVLKSNYREANNNEDIAVPDRRGKHKPANAFSDSYKQNLIEFILKYKPQPSHYRLAHAPNRLYLPIGVTITQIFEDYTKEMKEQDNKPCSLTYFKSIIKELNISTCLAKEDQCEKCIMHKLKHPDEESHKCEDCVDCTICNIYPVHIKNKNNSRKDFHDDQTLADNSMGKIGIFTVDMQKVLSIPKLTAKEAFFSRKLIMFNETFASPGKNKPSICVLWHEGEGGRHAFNVASAYIKFINSNICRDFEEIIFYADNCNAQNKNKILFSALIRLINNSNHTLKKIKIEYFEPGHTYMTADSVHGNITRKINAQEQLYDFNDFVRTIKNSRKNLDVEILDYSDFILFQNEMKYRQPQNLNISKLKVVEFRRGFTDIFVKNEYDGEFYQLNAFKKVLTGLLSNNIKTDFELDLVGIVPKQIEERGISEIKKKDLLKLCSFMPINRKVFFENLKINDNVKDLDIHNDSDL